jgi:hypothetical protein
VFSVLTLLSCTFFATSEGTLYRFNGGFFQTDVPSSQYQEFISKKTSVSASRSLGGICGLNAFFKWIQKLDHPIQEVLLRMQGGRHYFPKGGE